MENPRPGTRPALLFLLSLLMLAVAPATLKAQRAPEVKTAGFNALYVPYTSAGGPATPSGPPADAPGAAGPRTPKQYSTVGSTGGGSGVFYDSAANAFRRPSAAGGGVVIARSSIGTTFTTGMPRYYLGDEILPPMAKADGTSFTGATAAEVLAAARLYWRPSPVLNGEVITVRDTLSGTLANPVQSPMKFGYSPHAEKVYAIQPGPVTTRWVTRVPEGSNANVSSVEETFLVSNNSLKTVNRIYWNKRSFDGPIVVVGDSRIVTVNPYYNNDVPEQVANEIVLPGIPAVPNSDPGAIRRSIWFERYGNEGSLHAYNVEGRVVLEYLGGIRQGKDVHESLGIEVVDIIRAPEPNYLSVSLGEEIKPHDGDASLTASPKLVTSGEPAWYGTTVQADGTQVYHAERETGSPNVPEDGKPVSIDAYNKVVFYWLKEGNFNIKWPTFQDRYWQRWPVGVEDYAHNTALPSGSPGGVGVAFDSGVIPGLVYQDDGAQTEAVINPTSQRFQVTFAGTDELNRSLLKFSANGKVWYVRVYTQSSTRQGYQEGNGDGTLTMTVPVGSRIDPPADYTPPGGGPTVHYELGGYIASGTGYNPGSYINPLVAGVEAAGRGAVIPVNAMPNNKVTEMWWYRKISPPSSDFQPIYLPSKVGRYTAKYPEAANKIIIAQGIGTGDLQPDEAAGSLYVQNFPNLPGFNPNEEHAIKNGIRAYPVRDDLNLTENDSSYTSEPYLLLSYINHEDQRPDMKIWKVVRETPEHPFNYPAVAESLLNPPYPLPIMPQPLDANGKSRNVEVQPEPADQDPAPGAATPAAWSRFTMLDRKGFHRVYRGPHAGNGAEKRIAMQFYYVSRPDFFVPGVGVMDDKTILPFLRPLVDGVPQGHPITGTPLTIYYNPKWPENAPSLQVGETLTLAKLGLPQVRGQASAEVFYEQSRALGGETKHSVTLHDPTREKILPIDTVGLEKLPDAIATSSYLGRSYFQRLSPELAERIYFDRLRGPKGSLIFKGEFVDETVGEDYLNLNVLTADQIKVLKGLVPDPGIDQDRWAQAIDGLKTRVDTYKENPLKKGTYTVDSSVTVKGDALAKITSAETAVDSYALTATGEGEGYVTMVFGNGSAFTPPGDPVQVKVFKVVPQLYTGELKVLLSKNPLDEQVTLRHTGDYAGRPEDYEFEWGYAPGLATAPPVYSVVWQQRLGRELGSAWDIVRNPAGLLPTPAEYLAADADSTRNDVQLPRNLVIRDSAYTVGTGLPVPLPGVVLRSTATTPLNFQTGVPGDFIFSADLDPLHGFVLYVNGVAALANQAPVGFVNTDAVTGLVKEGLSRQFHIPRSYFTAGQNRLEVALYTNADIDAASGVNFRLDVAVETDVMADNYQKPSDPLHRNTNTALVGGDVSLPFGGPAFTLNDRWFTMRYRAKNAGNVANTGKPDPEQRWSRWLPPQFVEGWIKRVLREINPFQQRMKDLFNNEVNTDTSVLTQAGTRWEGAVALTLDNINDVGLISIYETVIRRAKSMSIDANTDDPDTNNALQLAAGYLSDLYALLGNEAFADAANPTISLGTDGSASGVSTSRYSFENQEPSMLREERSLLVGLDGTSTNVKVAPVYNRLYWNYTGGINAGEVIYATNYNIKEKAGSPTADGIIDAADAARMFPQGHGDAYGHYLTALSGYYRLLANPKFTWQTRAEAITVLGQAVTVDYVDERKLAGDAALVARTAERVCNLIWREQYKDDPAAGWQHFRDSDSNRAWGLDEWTSRASQGAYYHWVTANSLVPANDEFHTGVQKIDRSTVPELNELAATLTSFQTIADNAGSRLNPLGLSPGSMAFDLAPNIQDKSHFQQIQERALQALSNASASFKQAAAMTGELRKLENQVDNFNTAVVAQENTYRNELIEIFGRPYEGSVGPGKTYAQGYNGPDTAEWFIVDRPNDLDDTVSGSQVNLRVLKETAIDDFTNSSIQDIINDHDTQTTQVTVKVSPNQFIQYSDRWTENMGTRPETGELQAALLDCHRAMLDYQDAMAGVTDLERRFKREGALILEMIASHAQHLDDMQVSTQATMTALKVQKSMEYLALVADNVADVASAIADGSQEMLPKVLGLAADGTAPARGGIKLGGAAVFAIAKALGTASSAVAMGMEVQGAKEPLDLQYDLDKLDFQLEEKQQVYEFEQLYRELTGYSLSKPALAYQQANERVRNVLARGLRVMEERESFRKRSAAIIQGYRTMDVSLRIIRNEPLEQYRSLFDLACRYVYLAAKSYDYETGLLGTPQGQDLLSGIVGSRSLGDLSSSGGASGDSGLAGSMVRLAADFSVAQTRLGINNPDIYSTLFKLRSELFRIPDRSDVTSDDDAWRQVLEQHFKSDLLADADVATWCRNIKRPDGAPVPGIVIPFSTTIQHGLNFFGLPLAAGDHAYSPTNFATKISRVGIALPGYVGMDVFAAGSPTSGLPALTDPLALSATPYVYVIPTGMDYLLAPPLGDTNEVRSWKIEDQALPLPFNLGASAFNSTQFLNANGTLSSQPWVLRKHQAFRPVADPLMFQGEVPAEFTNTRLIARSVWNSGWKIIIPAYTLLNNEQEGLNRFAATVKDIQLYIKSYSHSGN